MNVQGVESLEEIRKRNRNRIDHVSFKYKFLEKHV